MVLRETTINELLLLCNDYELLFALVLNTPAVYNSTRPTAVCKRGGLAPKVMWTSAIYHVCLYDQQQVDKLAFPGGRTGRRKCGRPPPPPAASTSVPCAILLMTGCEMPAPREVRTHTWICKVKFHQHPNGRWRQPVGQGWAGPYRPLQPWAALLHSCPRRIVRVDEETKVQLWS